jgi:hypothetical protein
MRRSLAIMAVLAGLLQGCIPDFRTDKVTGADAGALTGAAVEVSPLDAPADDAARLTPAMVDAAESAALPEVLPEDQPLQPLTPKPTGAGATPDPEAVAVPVEPQAPKSAEQQRCEKKGGKWSLIGESKARTCLRQTRDSGKMCDNKKDCDGQCLSRSKTCAPFDPLLGCNDVIQDNGATVTLCID